MSPRQPNVLWIMCDELRSDAVGVYGNEYAPIETPNIDSIAEEGVRFDRFYVDSPVCVSARSAYKSGLLPTTTGSTTTTVEVLVPQSRSSRLPRSSHGLAIARSTSARSTSPTLSSGSNDQNTTAPTSLS